MGPYTLSFGEVDETRLPDVGGKGANLGELTRAGFPVPPGFCVTTAAYRDFVRESGELDALLDALHGVTHEELGSISALGGRVREHLGGLAMPDGVRSAVLAAWQELGTGHAYAVRSSATAEDLPSASFAGQQDTFLNVRGEEQLLEAVRRCWTSLFTDRAISYRAKHGFRHRAVFLAVVVQRMVFPEASGIMFTADPITGRRQTVCIDASFGLGEALVAGLVTADQYRVRSGAIATKWVSRKALAIRPLPDGGTVTEALPPGKQERQALPDDQILELAGLGLRIEEHYGREQDIEWCLADGKFFIVQARPITSLYPAPRAADGRLHLYVSFGHPQMMTEAMKPLGISVLRTFLPVGDRSPSGESELMQEAGGRIFIDLNPVLRYRRLRHFVPRALPLADESIARAVAEFLGREDYLAALGPEKRLELSSVLNAVPFLLSVLGALLFRNLGRGLDGIERAMADRIAHWRRRVEEASGQERVKRVRTMLRELFSDLVGMRVLQNVLPGVIAFPLIGSLSRRWLGDTAELASLGRSPPGNVTTEMGLALGDLADVVRAHPRVIERLRRSSDVTLEDLREIVGGEEVHRAFATFLERYGMRGTGEIDISRPRWREAPTQVIPAIEGHLRGSSPGQHRREFRAGEEEAERAAARLLERLRATRGGALKAMVMRRLIVVYRSRIGLREHPKYYIVRVLDLAKRAILEEAAGLVRTGLLRSPDEVFWFSLEELEGILRARRVDRAVLGARRERFERDVGLRPPRVITSEGEVVTATAGAAVPEGALAGTAASAGIVEGRARVVLKLEGSSLEKGEILVAPYTDPAWTPLFPLASGLVTEVGGLMTHGAVVAREYGIPAVVGVDRATEAIPDGSLVRVNGSEGFVEIIRAVGSSSHFAPERTANRTAS
jgi:pyruvate,water dikinase